jgi:hypothetical protein
MYIYMPTILLYTAQILITIILIELYVRCFITYVIYPLCGVCVFFTTFCCLFKLDIYFELPITYKSRLIPLAWVYITVVRLLFISHTLLGLLVNREHHSSPIKLSKLSALIAGFAFCAVIYLPVLVASCCLLWVWLSTPGSADPYQYFNIALRRVYYPNNRFESMIFYSVNDGVFRCNLKIVIKKKFTRICHLVTRKVSN